MKIRLLILLLMVFVGAGCSSINVHLYTRNLSLNDIKQAQDSLVSQGFTVIPNELDIPSDITSPTIIYSSMDAGGARLFELLTESLEKAGWPHIQHQLLLSGNHWYTKNNVGLILTASDDKVSAGVDQIKLATSYHLEGCSEKIGLSLNSDGTYSFNARQQTKNIHNYQTGNWSITALPYLELKSETETGTWFFYFEISEEVISDKVGEIDLVRLTPLNESFELSHCELVSGVRRTG